METDAFAQELARVCLDQAWISRADMNFLFLADLAAVEAALGTRGYRYVMMYAGRAAHVYGSPGTGTGMLWNRCRV